jgi:hypothetical protein
MAGAAVRPKEGEKIRDLLANAIDDLERTMSKRAFAEVRATGRRALDERDAEAARKAAERSVPAEPVEA